MKSYVARYIVVGICSVFFILFMNDLVIDRLISDAIPFFKSRNKALEPFEARDVTGLIALGILAFKMFVVTGLYILLYRSLWGNSGVAKGLFYGSMLWFFMIVNDVVAPDFLKYDVSIGGILYILLLFSVMFLLLGLFYGLTLKPLAAIENKHTHIVD